jgi:hypothetical protein
VRTRTPAAALALLFIGACGDADPDATGTFIALTADFRAFQSWPRTAVGTVALPEHPAGPRFAYANRPPPAAGMGYPVGTILVHTIETSADPQSWDVFAMAKRGGGYNANGAVGWEFFRLGMSADGVPVILGRGLNPSEGHSYGGGGATTQMAGCNTCHGAAVGDASDHILSPLLRPGTSSP